MKELRELPPTRRNFATSVEGGDEPEGVRQSPCAMSRRVTNFPFFRPPPRTLPFHPHHWRNVAMDVYDAQMFDYPADADVHMHTNNPSPRQWPHSDPAMEDDIEPLPIAAVHSTQSFAEDVEVDMEPAYFESTEYEMADDDSVLYGEIVDVDLADAPFEPPTQPHAISPVPPSLFPSIVEHQPTEVFDPSQNDNTASTPAEAHYPADSAVSDLGNATETADTEGVALSAAENDPELPSNIHNDAGEVSAELYDGPADFASQSEPYDGLSETHPEPYDGPAGDADAEAYGADSEIPQLHDHEAAEPVYDSPEHTEDAYHEVPHGGNAEKSGYEHDDAALGEEHAGEPEGDHDYYEGADPHEIMDGVYIEPPPAVLLDIPSASDQPECYLFNIPHTSSRNTPADSPPPSAASRSIILLQNQPTLYFERLSEVFDVLRQEEHVQHVPGLLDGEMVIDAYDLHLEIHEVRSFFESFPFAAMLTHISLRTMCLPAK